MPKELCALYCAELSGGSSESERAHDGVPVSTLQIARRYASSKWFYVDIVSTLPWELLFSALNTPATQTAFKFAG